MFDLLWIFICGHIQIHSISGGNREIFYLKSQEVYTVLIGNQTEYVYLNLTNNINVEARDSLV